MPLDEPLPRRQGKCRYSPGNEQIREEIGLEMFESVPGSIVDHNTATRDGIERVVSGIGV